MCVSVCVCMCVRERERRLHKHEITIQKSFTVKKKKVLLWITVNSILKSLTEQLAAQALELGISSNLNAACIVCKLIPCWSHHLYFLLFHRLFFVLFMASFAVQKFLHLRRFHLSIFAFVSFTVGDGTKKILLWFMLNSIWPMLSSRSFVVPGLTFRSLIHFKFLYMVLENILISFFCMLCPDFPASLIRETLFSPLYYIVLPSLSQMNWP